MNLRGFARDLRLNAPSLLPVVMILAAFRWVVVGEPMPGLAQRVGGMILLLLGLTFIVSGLECTIFPFATWNGSHRRTASCRTDSSLPAS